MPPISHLASRGAGEGVEAWVAPLQRHPQAAPLCLGQMRPSPLVAEVGAAGPWAGPCAHRGVQGASVAVAAAEVGPPSLHLYAESSPPDVPNCH